MAVNPQWIAFIPDPQTMLTVAAPTVSGIPAPRRTWRAGFWPATAWIAWPNRTSSISEAGIPERSIAARAARVPRAVAGTARNAPPNLPIGVRTAERMATEGSIGPVIVAGPDRRLRR